METIARHWLTGKWISVSVVGSRIDGVSPACPPTFVDSDVWISPAFWDIQTNGRWGTSFSDTELSSQQFCRIVRASAALGTARLCPTLITADRQATDHALRTIAAACAADPQIGQMVLGLHLEGPYISPLDGYRGSRTPASAASATPIGMSSKRWQDASRTVGFVLVTVERQNGPARSPSSKRPSRRESSSPLGTRRPTPPPSRPPRPPERGSARISATGSLYTFPATPTRSSNRRPTIASMRH